MLALLFLGMHDVVRAWKGFDWDALNRLHEERFIFDSRGKSISVVFTEEGRQRSKQPPVELFGKNADADSAGS